MTSTDRNRHARSVSACNAFALTALGLAVCGAARPAQSAPLVFDNSGSARGQSETRIAKDPIGVIGTVITVTGPDVPISRIQVFNRFSVAETIKFVIIEDTGPNHVSNHHGGTGGGGAVLYESAPQTFGPDSVLTWKRSARLDFTLRSGVTYDIGFVADPLGAITYSYGVSNSVSNGIASPASNANFNRYDPPANSADYYAQQPLRLEGNGNDNGGGYAGGGPIRREEGDSGNRDSARAGARSSASVSSSVSPPASAKVRPARAPSARPRHRAHRAS